MRVLWMTRAGATLIMRLRVGKGQEVLTSLVSCLVFPVCTIYSESIINEAAITYLQHIRIAGASSAQEG